MVPRRNANGNNRLLYDYYNLVPFITVYTLRWVDFREKGCPLKSFQMIYRLYVVSCKRFQTVHSLRLALQLN